MRSRYAAYALGLVDYVIATTAPGSPAWEDDEPRWRDQISAFCTHTRFVGLTVESEPVDGDRGWVTFRADLARGDQRSVLHERSTFVLRDGCWLYHSGRQLG